MIPLLATIVAIYCVIKLLVMAVQIEQQKPTEKFTVGIQFLCRLGAIAIVFLCLCIWYQADEFARMLRKV